MELKDRLVELRKKAGLTQKEFANKIHLTRETYAQYEIGRRSPNYDTLERIADFHEVSVDELLGRDEPPTKKDLEKMLDEYELTWGEKKLTEEQRKRAKRLIVAAVLDEDRTP